jgi:hypothetical protein
MILGTLAFLALVASACLGVAVLFAGVALTLTRTWRRLGLLTLGGGTFGALLGVVVLLVLEALLSVSSRSPLAVWLTFGAAGFGWGGMLSGGAFVAVLLLGRPTRWADRQRGAQA